MRALLDELAPAMREAGRLIEEIRAAGAVALQKADRTPVTQADHRAEVLLEAALAAAYPGTLVIGEEACALKGGVPLAERRFWLIDPLDGTKSFIEGAEDYSVNIGLVIDGEAVLGLLLAPRTGVLWTGMVGEGAWREDAGGKRPISTRALPERPVTVTSRSHLDKRTEAYVAAIGGGAVLPSGSSLKFCVLAEGEADVYPRFAPTSEWDTAAGHAILSAAGGAVRDETGAAFRYGKAGARNPGFLAVGDPAAFERLPALGG